MRLNHERSLIFFLENRRNCMLTERALSELDGGGLFRTFNSYSLNFNGGLRKRRRAIVCFELPAREASSFCDIRKLTSAISSHLSPL